MNPYTFAIKTAVAFFPALAFLITLPFLIRQYRKYGSVPLMRFVVIYLFVFYLLCVYMLVILPLPETMDYLSVGLNLRPFNYVTEIADTISFQVNNPASWIAFVLNSRWLEVIFNILMFIPLGIFLRYYKNMSLRKITLLSFLFSLFIELTQLSGLYFIFPRPYRLFDVNDLIDNTLGGILGFLIEPLPAKIIPPRSSIDEKAYRNGSVVTFSRRMIAFLFDSSLISLLVSVLKLFPIPLPYILIVSLVMTFVPTVWGGKTVGKSILRLKLEDISHYSARSRTFRLFVRQFIAWGILYGILCIPNDPGIDFMYHFLPEGTLFLLNIILLFFFLYDGFKSRKKSDKHFYYEEFTGIVNRSTIITKTENLNLSENNDK